jgi:hypothetical protein
MQSLLQWKRNEALNVPNVCVCSLRYPACIAHASYYIVNCGLPDTTAFCQIISQMARFSGKRHWTQYVFYLSLQGLSEIFIILKKNWKKHDKKFKLVFRYSTRYSCPILSYLELSWQILEKCSNIKFHENPPSGNRVGQCRQTDGRT